MIACDITITRTCDRCGYAVSNNYTEPRYIGAIALPDGWVAVELSGKPTADLCANCVQECGITFRDYPPDPRTQAMARMEEKLAQLEERS